VAGSRLWRAQRIFFPWESRGGWRRFLALTHVGPALALVAALLFLGTLVRREREHLAERRTLVALSEVKGAVVRYVVDHDGSCPERLELTLPHLSHTTVPVDGWGRPLRIVCNPSISDQDYIVMSDGPDGYPGGLDRIEY
jgi:hypothetical protein